VSCPGAISLSSFSDFDRCLLHTEMTAMSTFASFMALRSALESEVLSLVLLSASIFAHLKIKYVTPNLQISDTCRCVIILCRL
jgi:hypothetical protein